MKQQIIPLLFLTALTIGCDAQTDTPNEPSNPAAPASTQGRTLSEQAPLTLEECKSLHSPNAKDAVEAVRAACETSQDLPDAISGAECVRKDRYDACLKKFTLDQLH